MSEASSDYHSSFVSEFNVVSITRSVQTLSTVSLLKLLAIVDIAAAFSYWFSPAFIQ